MDERVADQEESPVSPEIEAQIVRMRDDGAAWKAIEERFGLNRQQARYAYQRGKRTERRSARQSGKRSGPTGV